MLSAIGGIGGIYGYSIPKKVVLDAVCSPRASIGVYFGVIYVAHLGIRRSLAEKTIFSFPSSYPPYEDISSI